MCRIRDKSKMISECARLAADHEIPSETITIQTCVDPDERGRKHMENIKVSCLPCNLSLTLSQHFLLLP